MQTNNFSLKNNHTLISQENLSYQCGLEHELSGKVNAVRRLTLLLGFAEATLANMCDKKRQLSKKMFNELTVFTEMRSLQEEIKHQLSYVTHLTSQLDEAEEVLAKWIG